MSLVNIYCLPDEFAKLMMRSLEDEVSRLRDVIHHYTLTQHWRFVAEYERQLERTLKALDQVRNSIERSYLGT